MKVLFDIPDDLSERFEFIPEEEISDVLSEVFRRGMESVDEVERKPEPVAYTPGVNLEELIQAVLVMQQNSSNKTIESLAAEKEREEVTIEEYAAPNVDTESEDELGDLLDLLK